MTGKVAVPRSHTQGSTPTRAVRTGWGVLALAGSTAFWSANFVISLTPVAADYRSAMSIPYVPMLVEAAIGGLVVASAIAFLLRRLPERIPGAGPLRQAVLLSVGALVLLTLLVDVPAKRGSDVVDPVHWLAVAVVFDTIRFLALGVTIGLVARRSSVRQRRTVG